MAAAWPRSWAGAADCWQWQYAGKVAVRKTEAEIALHDLTGFDGRCDALYFSTERREPPRKPGSWPRSRDRLSNPACRAARCG